MSVDVNYVAVLVSAIVAMVIGFLWYGPVFGKKWIALMKFTPEDMMAAKAKGMGKQYALTFVGSLVSAYVLWYVIAFTFGFYQQSGVWCGLSTAFMIWFGFILPLMVGQVLWDGKSWALFWLNTCYHLVNLLVMGAIMAAWI